MSRVARLLVVAALTASVLVVGTRPAAAADPRLKLLAQPAWSAIGGSATIQLDVPVAQLPADEPVTLRLRLYNHVNTMESFERSITGAQLSGRLTTRRLPLADLPRAADGTISVTAGIGNESVAPTLPVSQPGVYPLEIALESDDEVLTSFVTWIVAVDPAEAAQPEVFPLRVAWVWSVVSAPARSADGRPDPAVVSEFAPGGRLDGISSILGSAGATPLTLQIGPETIESWAALAQTDPTLATGYQRVAAAVARPSAQLLVAPYVPIDLTALEAAGLGSELPNQLVVGSDTLERVTGVRPDPRTAFVDPANSTVLSRLRQLLVDRVVVSDAQVADGDAPAEPFTVTAGSGTMRAAASTAIVDRMLDGTDPPALRVQRALTALSMIAFNEPEVAHGVVIAPPADSTPDVELHTALLAAMRSHPLLLPSTLDDLFSRVPVETVDDSAVVRELVAGEPDPMPITTTQYLNDQQALGSLRSSIDPESPVLAQGERGLLLALSTQQSPNTARTQLDAIEAGTQELNSGVTTSQKRVTLTSRKADVPLSFRNDTGRPLRVRVHLDSSKLLFPEGDDIELVLPEGNSSERFAVEARTSGTFTMTVTLTTQDGRLTIGPPTRVMVRSAVFSGVGAAITVGALIFLALWWGNHFRRTRRARAALGPS